MPPAARKLSIRYGPRHWPGSSEAGLSISFAAAAAAQDLESLAGSWLASKEVTSRRKSESPWQASRSQALRSAGSRSRASRKSDSICCQRSILPSHRHAPLQLVEEVQREGVMDRCSVPSGTSIRLARSPICLSLV